jgi:hypothetical protein
MAVQLGWMPCRKYEGLTSTASPAIGASFAGGIHDHGNSCRQAACGAPASPARFWFVTRRRLGLRVSSRED